MPRPELEPNRPGRITLTRLPDGRFRARARMRLQDRTRTDPQTGQYAPGKRVDLYAIVADSALAEHAIHKAAMERQLQAMRADAEITAKRPSDRVTVADAAVQRLSADAASLSESSRRSYDLQVSKHLAPSALGSMVLGDVTVADVDDYLAELAETSGMASAKHSKAVLARVFKWANRAGLVQRDPVRDAGAIRKPRQPKAGRLDHLDHKRALTRAERLALAWSIARDERAVRMDVRDIVLAGLALGGRLGEVLAIRWRDVQFTTDGRARVRLCGTLYRATGAGVKRGPMKTSGSERTITVPRRIAALLRRRARAQGLDLADLASEERVVFDAPGRWSMDPAGRLRDVSNTEKELRKAFDAAGFPWLSFHGLRRSAITMIADVRPVRDAASFAGHTNVTTTQRFYVARGEIAEEIADIL